VGNQIAAICISDAATRTQMMELGFEWLIFIGGNDERENELWGELMGRVVVEDLKRGREGVG
jgi:hypothetical protein